MARRLPKFPLKMANDENVRSIEELRANADMDSIVTYFLSGQLNLWCHAFGYGNLPEQFENVTCELIKNIYDVLEIPVKMSEIKAYVEENNIHVSGQSAGNVEMEEEVIDNEEVKKKLKFYVDSDIPLSDYSIETIPVNDDNGSLCKYKVIIANEQTEQYTSFVLPYDVEGNYKKNNFIDDFYKKIANTVKKQYDMFSYNDMKNSRYAELKVGDIFEFGVFEGKPITWIVLEKKNNELLVLSKKVLCERTFEGEFWEDSKIRNWLNNEFYNSAFNAGEKEFIKYSKRIRFSNKLSSYAIESSTVLEKCYFGMDLKKCNLELRMFSEEKDNLIQDYIFLLLGFEATKYFSGILKSKKYTKKDWMLSDTWCRSELRNRVVYGYHYVTEKYNFYGDLKNNEYCGIRPAFCLKY